MTYPLARLVSAPSPDATVRYDFNDVEALAGRSVFADGFTLGSPSLLTAPDLVSPLYGDRGLSFRHGIEGSEADAFSAVAVISRELLRPSGWFLYQFSAFTRPSWWRLRATGPEAVEWDRVYLDTESGDPVAGRSSAWVVPINLTAENFGYGERIELGPYVVRQDTGVVNPMRATLPTIKGDAPTALRVSVEPEGTITGQGGAVWMVGCASGDAAMTDVVLTASTAFIPIALDTSIETDADYFGGTYYEVQIDAGTPNLERRFSVIIPDTVRMGRYNVQMRCTVTDGSDQTLLFQGERWRNSMSTDPVPMPVVSHSTVAGDDFRHFWVDLGDTTIPFGALPPVDGGAVVAQTAMAVSVGTGDGSASSVNIDAIRLIPVAGDDLIRTTILQATFGLSGLGSIGTPDSITGVFDGDLESYWVSSFGEYAEQTPTLRGGFPTADPTASKNLLLLTAIDNGDVANAGATEYITTKGTQTTVRVSYHPRLLHLDGRP